MQDENTPLHKDRLSANFDFHLVISFEEENYKIGEYFMYYNDASDAQKEKAKRLYMSNLDTILADAAGAGLEHTKHWAILVITVRNDLMEISSTRRGPIEDWDEMIDEHDGEYFLRKDSAAPLEYWYISYQGDNLAVEWTMGSVPPMDLVTQAIERGETFIVLYAEKTTRKKFIELGKLLKT